MRVRVKSLYRFDPCMWDLLHPLTDLSAGDIVRVINLYGCPKANTMNHCYVANAVTGKFIGMVHTNSLERVQRSNAEDCAPRNSINAVLARERRIL